MNRDTPLDEQFNQQIQILIEQAAQFGVSPAVMAAIAPVLKMTASQLQHAQYFVLRTLDQNWVMTQFSQQSQPNVTKNVIYLFPTLEDATRGNRSNDPEILSLPIPTTHILFQLLAMKPVDRLIFFETPGNLQIGTEVVRGKFQDLVQAALQTYGAESRIPPNIA